MQIQCTCGNFQAKLKAFPKNTPGRLMCYCDDCQRYLHYIKRSDLLDQNAGTEIIPAYPADVEVLKGIEHLKCVRLSSKGMFRYYTSCCQSPVGNTSPNRAWVGFLKNMYPKDVEKILGPIEARIMGKFAKGNLPEGTPQKFDFKGFKIVMPFVLRGIVLRKANPSPFFQEDGKTSVVAPHVLSAEEVHAINL
jgi:hypothetical protein